MAALSGSSPPAQQHHQQQHHRAAARNLPRAVGLWVLALALPLCLVLLLHSRLPDGDAPFALLPSSALSTWRNRGQHRQRQEPSEPITVGVAVTVTGCGSTFPVDGAAVLRHSVLRHASDRYRYKFYAIYHPQARDCVGALAGVGYELLERDTPVNVSAIRGDYLRGRMPKSGCCGEKELIKFEAFTLTQHPVVLLMDMDMLVLKNLDDLLDAIVRSNPDPAALGRHLKTFSANETQRGSARAPPVPASASESSALLSKGSDIWLLYVSDYFLAGRNADRFPSQGGFAVLRPNRTIYREIQQIVLRGDYDESYGWKHSSGASTGIFWGATTFQGLLPYYFQIEQPGHSIELDWCLHDNMNSPRGIYLDSKDENHGSNYYCYEPGCQDCRTYSIRDVYSVHYTNCQKPWVCWRWHGQESDQDDPQTSLCREMYDAWFEYRSDLEVSWGRSGRGSGVNTTHPSLRGYCSSYGPSGYEPIRQPYGTPL